MLQRDAKPGGGGGGDAPCPRYGPGEVDKSRQEKGFLPQPVLPQAGPKILVADFGVDWRHVKQSVRDHPVLLRFLTEESKDPGVRFDVVGYSDCAGAEFNNTFLRTGRARRVGELLQTRVNGRPVTPTAAALKSYVADNDDQVGRAVNRGVVVEAKHPAAPVTPLGPVPFVAPESVAEMQEMLDDAENLLVDPSFLRPRDRQRLYGTTAVAPGWKPDTAGSLKRIDAVLQFVKPLVDSANVARHANDSLKSTILGQYYTSGYLETAVLSYQEVRRARDALPADAKGSVLSDLAVKAKSLFAFRSAAKLKILADEGVSFELESGSSPRPAPEFRSSMRGQLPGGAGLDKRELRVLAWLRDNKDTILAAETSFRVDRRAIGAVIAWEAMKNVMRGGLRGVGPGKMHTYSSKWAGLLPFLPKGEALPQQVEAAGLVPKAKSDDDRAQALTTPSGSTTYIAAAMRGASDIATRYGYDMAHNVVALTSFYQGHDLPSWEKHMKAKKDRGDTDFVAADPIAVWSQTHMAFLESVLGPTP